MFLFAVTALEQFIDKLQQWPQYLTSLVQITGLKNSPALFDRVNEKFNEINNKNKIKDNAQGDGKTNYQYNNMVNNIINFDIQVEEKRSNKDLSQISKMPVFPNDEFNRNFKNVSSNEKPIQAVPPYMMQPGNFIPPHNYFQQGNKVNVPKSMLTQVFFLYSILIISNILFPSYFL